MEPRYITAIVIVLIVMVASVFRAKYRTERKQAGGRDDGETQRLREEVRLLRERLQVLERITVEKENSLEREIERLRDQ